MTAQEILEGVTRHRASLITSSDAEVVRKINEIEWALQAIAEWMCAIEPKIRP